MNWPPENDPPQAQRRLCGWDHLLGALMGGLYVAALLSSSANLAMSRDESFYVYAAERYGSWFEILLEDPGRALERSTIDSRWDYNHEHPALMKSLFAWSALAQKHWKVFPQESMAFRFPGMLSAGLLLCLIYIFGARVRGRVVGLFAVAAFASMPRIFYHSELDCFDVPIVLMLTW
ncbi:MAG: hypothetical protein KC416_17730, partial [Myxococcales bacterium]|nr:hypothetical protein [Myxococcales bacterium]